MVARDDDYVTVGTFHDVDAQKEPGEDGGIVLFYRRLINELFPPGPCGKIGVLLLDA